MGDETLSFEAAGGCVIGRDHGSRGRNGQDALHWSADSRTLVAVVCDGCGSGRRSEVGAALGARLVAQTLSRHLQGSLLRGVERSAIEELLRRTRDDVLARLQPIAAALSTAADRAQTVHDFLLFTVVGAAAAGEAFFTFLAGDGLIALNGQVDVIEAPENAPPYLAYGLLTPECAPALELHALRHVRDVQSALIGTDGLHALAARSATGGGSPRRALAEFWEDDRYFSNPQAVSRRLTLLARETTRIDWSARSVGREHGPLTDDAALVVLRRRGRDEG